jgi:hypothetical protein
VDPSLAADFTNNNDGSDDANQYTSREVKQHRFGSRFRRATPGGTGLIRKAERCDGRDAMFIPGVT